MWGLLVAETNRYCEQVGAKLSAAHPEKTQRAWDPVNVEVMKSFVGMIMLMGVVTLPRLELYWTTKHPRIRPDLCSVMPQKKFEQILSYLYLNDSDNQVPRGEYGYDPLFKVRKLLDFSI